MQDLILDIIVSGVFILVGIISVLLGLYLAIHHMPFGPMLLQMLERKMEDIGVVHEKTRSMRRMLDKGRELLRCGDWAGARVQFNAALMLEPDLAKKITKGYRADLLSELSARGKITATWQIRRILEEN